MGVNEGERRGVGVIGSGKVREIFCNPSHISGPQG